MTQGGLVILDRDGVINVDRADYVRQPAQWQPIPGSLDAIARLATAGYDVAIATNQSAIARGLLDRATLDAIHDRLRSALAERGAGLAHIAYCPHGPQDGCRCRKPAPGLLEEIAVTLGASLTGVPFVGDSQRDLDAARAAGCTPVLVRTGHGATLHATDVAVYDDLASFVDAWLTADDSRDGPA